MPHCPCNVVDAGCLSADQTGENLLEHIEAWQMCIWITDVSWASTTIPNNTKNCEFLLWSISSHKKKIGKRSTSAWPFQAPRKYVCHWGHHKIWMDSVATLTLQHWPQTMTFSPLLCVCVFFIFLTQRTVTLCRCQAMHWWLQRRDGDFYWVETHGFVWRWKKVIDKEWDYMAK